MVILFNPFPLYSFTLILILLTCLVNVMALTTGVVVSFMKAGFGGNIQPSRARNSGWFPNGIIDSITQKIACILEIILVYITKQCLAIVGFVTPALKGR